MGYETHLLKQSKSKLLDPAGHAKVFFSAMRIHQPQQKIGNQPAYTIPRDILQDLLATCKLCLAYFLQKLLLWHASIDKFRHELWFAASLLAPNHCEILSCSRAWCGSVLPFKMLLSTQLCTLPTILHSRPHVLWLGHIHPHKVPFQNFRNGLQRKFRLQFSSFCFEITIVTGAQETSMYLDKYLKAIFCIYIKRNIQD